jgi:histone H2A
MATPSKKSVKRSAKKSAKKSASGLIFPTGRVGSMLRKGRYAKRVSASSGVYLAAVLEYLTAELLELSAKAVAASKKKSKRITPRAVCLAVRHDADLGNLLKDVTLSRGGVVPSVHKALEKKKGKK